MKLPKSILAIMALLLVACQSAPPPSTPEPEPTKTVPDTPVDPNLSQGTKTTQEALKEAEVAQVEKAIRDAEEADGFTFAPDLMNKAKSDLELAKKLGSTGSPDEARKYLASALEAAREALKLAQAGQIKFWKDRLAAADAAAKESKSDLFLPEDYTAALGLRTQAEDLLAQDGTAGKAKAQEALAAYSSLLKNLEAKTGEISRLKADTSARLAEAEALEAFIWVPETLEAANDAYFRGADSFRRYNLSESLEAYTQSRFLAGKAVQEARNQKAKKETEDLMLETMRQIERASNLIIIDENDEVLSPEPWDGTKFLKSPSPEPQSLLLPSDGSAVVLEEVSRVTYLTQAKELWFKGVDEKNLGNFPLANQYFLEAQKLLRLYESLAVDKLYTVRLIPERRDALWRIAEYPSIYGDPLQWPLIWKRNRKLIQNPDLIYPGWQLVIPPR